MKGTENDAAEIRYCIQEMQFNPVSASKVPSRLPQLLRSMNVSKTKKIPILLEPRFPL